MTLDSHQPAPPSGVRVTVTGEGDARTDVFSVSWFQGVGVLGVVFSLIMALPAAVFWISGEDSTVAFALSVPPLGLLYWSLAAIFNRTTVTVSGDTLSAHAGPIPWPHGFDAPLDRVEGISLQEIRRVRNGRTVGARHDAIALVGGVPQRLIPGVSDGARHRFLVGVLPALIAARRAGAGRAVTSAPIDRAIHALAAADTLDAPRLAETVQRLEHLEPPFAAGIDSSGNPFVYATLVDEAKPAFGRLHLELRPDDFRKRIWVRHMEQLIPLMQLGTPLRLTVGLRGGTHWPVLGVEAAVDLDLEAALALQPHVGAAALAKLRVVLGQPGMRITAIESRFAPPGLLTSTFHASPPVSQYDGLADRLGVLPSHRQSLRAALASGPEPHRIGVVAVSDAVMPSLVVETRGEARALSGLLGSVGAFAGFVRDAGLVTVSVRYHAETAPLVSVSREIA